jgi:hypothetical protein
VEVVDAFVAARDGEGDNGEAGRDVSSSARSSQADAHHPLPQGCDPTPPSAGATAGLGMLGDRAWPVGDTGILLGSRRSGVPPDVWGVAEAVLNCGCREHVDFSEGSVGTGSHQSGEQPRMGRCAFLVLSRSGL